MTTHETDDPPLIATNSITAIKVLLRNFASSGAQNENIDVLGVWTKSLEMPEGATGTLEHRARIVQTTSQLVLPLCNRARYQLGPSHGSMTTALDQAESYLARSILQNGLGGQNVRDELKILISATSALTTAEEAIALRWHPIPAEILDEIESSVDDLRQLFQGLVDDGSVDPLLTAPLDELLDLALYGIALSRAHQALFSLGVNLRNISSLGTEIAIAGITNATPESDVRWADVVEVLNIIQLLATVVVVAGFASQSALVAMPAAVGLATLIDRTDKRDAVLQKTHEVWTRLMGSQVPPALEAGSTDE
ncbi:MAG: hypothetical protein AAGA65_31055 [Actinomycetota bacterium]